MPKFKIIVSDLHIGAGPPGGGNPLEDFTLDDEFVAFLSGIDAESERTGADAELIFNGDTFEMLQVPHQEDFDPAEEYPAECYHSSREEDSARKMALIIRGHPAFFGALRRFLQPGRPQRRITFVKGNHDVDLYWPGVQVRIGRALDASGAREPLVSFAERRVHREGIYVEHGNQYAERVDRLRNMEEPLDPGRPGQLDYPPGSWFVMNILNRVERQRYWIDGVKPITALVWFALKYDFAFAADAIATLLRALPGTLGDALLAVDDAQAESLIKPLADPEERQEIARRYQEEPAFRARFHAELARLLTPQPSVRGRAALALVPSPDAMAMGEEIRRRMRFRLFDAARRKAREEDVPLVVFGHTHEPGGELLPGGALYMNCGTWTWRGDWTARGERLWRELFQHPERFTGDRLLSYVRVDYDDSGRPRGRLLEYECR